MDRLNDLKDVSDLLLGLKICQNYSISFNGERADRSIFELTDRIDCLLDEGELASLGLLARRGETSKVMDYLACDVTDFYFSRDES